MTEPLDDTKIKVALACQVLADEGLVDGILGHVSARVPGTNDMLIRCRSNNERGVFLTQAADIRQVTFDGQGPGLGDRHDVPKEYPIHGEIYKTQPDVHAVIHAHPPAVLACGIAGLELRPIFGAFNIPAMRLALNGIPIYPRSCLITRTDLAAEMLAAMGHHNVCLLKGHGITVTGETVEQATVRALDFNALAAVTLEVAKAGGTPENISDADIAELPDLGTTFNDQWAWRYYVAKLVHRRGEKLANGLLSSVADTL